MKKFLGKLITLVLLAGLGVYGLSYLVVSQNEDDIVCRWDGQGFTLLETAPAEFFDNRDMAEPGTLDLPDCVIVLGAGLAADGGPSAMLRDRLDMAIYLYNEEYVPKILLTGDNGEENYNEIKAMLDYTLAQGVPAEDVFCDYAGFSTYESMYRAQAIFQVREALVVTQSYHLYRALYIGKALGMDVMGAASDQQAYRGQLQREVREVLARDKDIVSCLLKLKPKYLGDPVPITGRGNAKET